MVVVSNIVYFHPYLGTWSNLTNIFLRGWNHQLVDEFMMNYKVTQWHGDWIFASPCEQPVPVSKIWIPEILLEKIIFQIYFFWFPALSFFSRNIDSCSQNHGSEKNGVVFERYVLFEMHNFFHWTIGLCAENSRAFFFKSRFQTCHRVLKKTNGWKNTSTSSRFFDDLHAVWWFFSEISLPFEGSGWRVGKVEKNPLEVWLQTVFFPDVWAVNISTFKVQLTCMAFWCRFDR